MNKNHAENLFRKQAIRSLAKKLPGRPICLMPHPWLWLNALVVTLFAATAVFIGNAEYSHKESVRGWLVSRSGIIRVVNNTAAVVSQVARQPGDYVTAGDPLIYLTMDSTLSDGSAWSEQVLTQLRHEVLEIDVQLNLSRQQQAVESGSLEKQLQVFVEEVAALSSRIREQKKRIGLSREKLSRVTSAVVDGAVTQWDVLRQQEDFTVLEQDLSQLEQSKASQQREHETLKEREASLPVRASIQRSTLRARRLQLTQQIAEQELRRLSVLTSPVSGTVSSVEVHVGSSIEQQQLLVTVLPKDMDLAAELFVPSRAAGLVRRGQTVHITYDAFPQQTYGKFVGRVERVSKSVFMPGEIRQPFPLLEASYKVQVQIRDAKVMTGDGTVGLRPGMLLAAELVLEPRNLIDWLLEPLRFNRSRAQ